MNKENKEDLYVWLFFLLIICIGIILSKTLIIQPTPAQELEVCHGNTCMPYSVYVDNLIEYIKINTPDYKEFKYNCMFHTTCLKDMLRLDLRGTNAYEYCFSRLCSELHGDKCIAYTL